MTINSPDHIQTQLERILDSEGFSSSRRLCQFLRYVVEHTLQGQADQIKQYTVGVEAMGFPTTFDPQANPTVRIHARKLRRELDRYYLTEGRDDPILIEIPKGAYVPVFRIKPGSMPLAGAIDETICAMPADTATSVGTPFGPSVAIMPFDYLGKPGEYDYMASGITEEIIIALTRFPEFLVVGPLNREIIREKQWGPRALGREYSVRFLLDGTMRLRGQTVRLTTRLTDTASGSKIWGRTKDYDIRKTSLDQIEYEIVNQIVTTIADNFGVIPRTMAKEILSHHNDSLSDYAAILRFHHHVRVLTEESLTEAIEALENVVQCDPDHDLALALLGDLISTPYWLGYTDDQYDLGRAKELGKRALARYGS